MQLALWLLLGLILGPSFLEIPMMPGMQTVSAIAGALFLGFAGWEMRFLDLRRNFPFYSKLYIGTFLFPLVMAYAFFHNLFIAVAMAISALPIAIQILKEKGLYETALSRKTITMASLADISSWLIIAFLVPTSEVSSWIKSHWLILSFFAGMLLGQFVPLRDQKGLVSKSQKWILAPLFFTMLGIQINLQESFSFIHGMQILGVGVFVKLGGGYVAARWAGEDHRTAVNLGSLLNVRGAMEIIAAQFAFKAQLIDATVFSSLVILGALTSFMAVFLVKNPHRG